MYIINEMYACSSGEVNKHLHKQHNEPARNVYAFPLCKKISNLSLYIRILMS